MKLTQEDLNAIGGLIDARVEPLKLKIDGIDKKVDVIGQYMNLTEVISNSKPMELGLIKKIHKANRKL